MTRKHYVEIARILKRMHDIASTAQRDTVKDTAENLARYFAAENPLFDKARFLAACGINRKEENK